MQGLACRSNQCQSLMTFPDAPASKARTVTDEAYLGRYPAMVAVPSHGHRSQSRIHSQHRVDRSDVLNRAPPMAHLLPSQIPVHSRTLSHLHYRPDTSSVTMNVNTSFKCPSSIPQPQYLTEMTSAPNDQLASGYQFASDSRHHAPPHLATGTVRVSVPMSASTGSSISRSRSGSGASQYIDSVLCSATDHDAPGRRHHHQFSSNPSRSGAVHNRHNVPPLIAVQDQMQAPQLMRTQAMHSHNRQRSDGMRFDSQFRDHQRIPNHLELAVPVSYQKDVKTEPIPLNPNNQFLESRRPYTYAPFIPPASASNPFVHSLVKPIDRAATALSNIPRIPTLQETVKANDERAPSYQSGSGTICSRSTASISNPKPRRIPPPCIIPNPASRFRSVSAHGQGAVDQPPVRSGGRRVTASSSNANRTLDGNSGPAPLGNNSVSNAVSFPSGDRSVDRYIGIKRIGAGTFADIWEVYDRLDPSKKHWALKVLKARKYEGDQRKVAKYESAMISEGNRIRKLNNMDPNGSIPIVRCKEVLILGGGRAICAPNPPIQKPCIVLELVGISLLQYIQICSSKNLVIGLRTVRAIAVQLFSAMSFLHGKGGYIHADLKPENVLITLEDSINGNLWTNIHPKIKVVDLGNALSYHRNINTFEVQSLYYRAPEVLFGNEISAAIDMWSIGCILVELININEFNRKTAKSPNQAEREKVNVGQRRPVRRAHHALLACRSTVGLAQKIHSVLSKFPRFVYNPFYSFNLDQMAAAFVPPRVMTDLNTSYQAMKASRKRKLYDRLSIEINETTTEYQQFIDLIAGLLDLDPSTRFTSEDAIQHQFCIETRWLEPPIVDLLASVYDSAYPIISISDDDDRQMRVNLQIQQYQMIIHRANSSLHPPPPKPKQRAITTKNSAFNAPFPGTMTTSASSGIVHNRAICVINGCCQNKHNLGEERLSNGEDNQSIIAGKQPPVKKMKVIL